MTGYFLLKEGERRCRGHTEGRTHHRWYCRDKVLENRSGFLCSYFHHRNPLGSATTSEGGFAHCPKIADPVGLSIGRNQKAVPFVLSQPHPPNLHSRTQQQPKAA